MESDLSWSAPAAHFIAQGRIFVTPSIVASDHYSLLPPRGRGLVGCRATLALAGQSSVKRPMFPRAAGSCHVPIMHLLNVGAKGSGKQIAGISTVGATQGHIPHVVETAT